MTEKDFISTTNKAMIWQLLMDANAFVNIPDTYFDNIKTIYEQIIVEISNLNNMSLTDRNKMLMTKMMEKIRYFTNEHIQKPLQEVKIKVNEEFQNKKQEFIQLVNHNKPTDVSFSDDVDKPFNDEELNLKLNSLINDRSYDTLPPLPKSKEYTVDTKPNEPNEPKENESKKVSFVPSTENIISKLKTKETKESTESKTTEVTREDNNDIKNILNLLRTISINQQLTLKNQDRILELLLK